MMPEEGQRRGIRHCLSSIPLPLYTELGRVLEVEEEALCSSGTCCKAFSEPSVKHSVI
jgi:hypothetical protein